MSVLLLIALIGGPLLLTITALAAHSMVRGSVDTRHEWQWVRVIRPLPPIGVVVAGRPTGAWTLVAGRWWRRPSSCSSWSRRRPG